VKVVCTAQQPKPENAMKTTDIEKIHDAGLITGARRGESRLWRIEDISAQRGHPVHSNDLEEI